MKSTSHIRKRFSPDHRERVLSAYRSSPLSQKDFARQTGTRALLPQKLASPGAKPPLLPSQAGSSCLPWRRLPTHAGLGASSLQEAGVWKSVRAGPPPSWLSTAPRVGWSTLPDAHEPNDALGPATRVFLAAGATGPAPAQQFWGSERAGCAGSSIGSSQRAMVCLRQSRPLPAQDSPFESTT